MNKNKTKDLKVNIKFDITMLDLMLKFSISKNIVILRKHLTALYKLIDMINEDRYKGDANLLSRLLFLKFILHAKLIEKYDNLQIVLDYAKSKLDNKYLELVEETVLPDMIDDLSTADVNYIIQKVNNNTKYAYLYKYVDSLGNLHDMLTDDAYNNIEDINARASNVMSMMNNDIRKVKAESLMEQDFDLLSDDVMDNLSAIIEAYKQPESILKTGYARLNELMEGGFHKGRIYCYMGSTGGFKSGLLINLLRGIKVNNDDYKTKDPEKKPMILYITQENSVRESVARLFATASPEHIKNFTPEEAAEMLKGAGVPLGKNNEGVNIRMRFIPGGTVNTEIFYDIISELDEEGYEVICLLHDYIKTMKPVDKNADLRIAMSNVVREMKYVGVNYDIPVITVAQLNRDAAKTIDSAAGSSKADVTRMLGRSNVGESWSMVEEMDFAAIINIEFHELHDLFYLVFKCIKIRYANPPITYFAQPFERDNTFKIVEDIELDKPVSVLTMTGNYSDIDSVAIGGKSKSITERKELSKQLEITKETDTSFADFITL